MASVPGASGPVRSDSPPVPALAAYLVVALMLVVALIRVISHLYRRLQRRKVTQ